MLCKCYHAERNFFGKIGVCWGTKECEPCSCGGYESKCDFYDYVRERARKKEEKPMYDELVKQLRNPWQYNGLISDLTNSAADAIEELNNIGGRQLTLGDMIRNMTNEELAKFLARVQNIARIIGATSEIGWQDSLIRQADMFTWAKIKND